MKDLQKIFNNFASLSLIKENFEAKSNFDLQKIKQEFFLHNIQIKEFTEVPSYADIRHELFSQMENFSDNHMNQAEFFEDIRKFIFGSRRWDKGGEAHRKGIISEYQVRMVLRQLLCEHKIINFMFSENDSSLDHQGVDVLIVIIKDNQRQFLPLQIKSSIMGQQSHIQKEYEMNDLGIPSIRVNQDLHQIKNKILHVISCYKYEQVEHV